MRKCYVRWGASKVWIRHVWGFNSRKKRVIYKRQDAYVRRQVQQPPNSEQHLLVVSISKKMPLRPIFCIGAGALDKWVYRIFENFMVCLTRMNWILIFWLSAGISCRHSPRGRNYNWNSKIKSLLWFVTFPAGLSNCECFILFFSV